MLLNFRYKRLRRGATPMIFIMWLTHLGSEQNITKKLFLSRKFRMLVHSYPDVALYKIKPVNPNYFNFDLKIKFI